MSIPETTTNPYKLRALAIDRAVKAWQEQDKTEVPLPDGSRLVPSTLEDCLNGEGLILLPRSTGHGKWRVLVDGQPAPYPGQEGPSHPMGAEEAADVFLTVTAADHYGERQIVVRPATSDEMVTSAVIGDTTVREEPVKIAPTVFDMETDEITGATLIRMLDKDGRAVHVGLDDNMRNLLASMLDTEDGVA
ncbi:hypothetical protein ACQEUU_37015 [Nonomuraea sp. CA-218870]|uniref:hypothetical protein n=1 Tax=Nonomuraea sp. CA-218870 TaxID=3239998 RepID=UPI003D919324